MIAPKAPSLKRMLSYVGWPLLLLIVWDLLVAFAYMVLHWYWLASKSLPLALYGSAIGVVVGFRNNSAYGRWWEGRTLWGQIVNNSRSLARQICTSMHPAENGDHDDLLQLAARQKQMVYHQIAFVHALRQQLRGLSPWEDIAPFLEAEELEALRREKNVPLALQQCMGRQLRDAKSKGWVDALEWQAIDKNLDDLADAQGGLERIKNTPMP
jgi:putative membrane protein